MPLQTHYFVLRSIRSQQATSGNKFMACSMSGQDIVVGAMRMLEDSGDDAGRERLSGLGDDPAMQLKMAVSVQPGRGAVFLAYPVTVDGADAFVEEARRRGLKDEAKAQVHRFI